MNADLLPASRKVHATTKLVVRAQNAIANREERGAAMAEYGLLLAFVALAAMGILLTFGSSIKNTFAFANDTFTNAPGASGAGNSTAN